MNCTLLGTEWTVTFWALLMKMNVPEEEAEELVENLGAKNMGYLFENAEKMDIQAERRNTREARERADAAEARAEAEKARAEAAEAKADVAEAKAETEKARAESVEAQKALAVERADAVENSLRVMIGRVAGLCRDEGLTKEETRIRLHELYQVSESDLKKYFEDCWQSD